ncbi:peptidase s41 family protein [Diplodia corticola]|uniref:Peptidase s41 family protein n=1 Tax=Diplodia corticola TaxID=236234 RepID=A0A1J9QSY3_9PEZI|nr:peptidase s41 family protein [Diplodia corticola]OJD31513.1 peptidase s41 family protein [Diplodia corticola]
MKLPSLTLAATLAVLAAASPLTTSAHGACAKATPSPSPSYLPSLHARQNTTGSPCSVLSSVVNNGQVSAATPTVPAALAYDCLMSAPLNKPAAIELLDSMKPYLDWQSTQAYLKNPPAEYAEKVQPSVDLMQGLDDLAADVNADKFVGEYEFGWALYNLILSAHDGHLVYVPDSVGAIVTWGRPISLVSISEDGQKLPVPFVYQDILAASLPNSTYTPSAVLKIDDEDAATYLKKIGQYGSLQDPDALFNNLMYSLPQIQLGSTGASTGMFSGGGRGRWVYPGPTTKLDFANGTSQTFENFARVLVSFRNVENGTALGERYFLYDSGATAHAMAMAADAKDKSRIQAANMNVDEPQDDTSVNQMNVHVAAAADAAATTTRAVTRATPAPGFPTPVIFQKNNLIAGYYLEGEGYEDIAVLSVPSFVSSSYAELDFQRIGTAFILGAKAAGKTKLIIDLSANGGGTILQGYDMFKQLFPSILPYGGTRFRAHETLDLLGQKFSYLSEGFPREPEIVQENYTMADIVSSVFNYRTDADVDYKPFTSWAEKYGPHANEYDNFTSIIRWNMSDPLNVLNSGGIEVSGYGNRSNFTDQPFESTNMVLLYDGYCASTCAIFSELMRQQGNVSSIVVGGRPQYAAQQAVGGVKGFNNFNWAAIQQWVYEAYQYASPEEQTKYNATYQANYTSYVPFNRAATDPNVNVRDGLRQGDDTGTPLQFTYETADCRMFYTAEMTLDITAVWKAAADSKWGDVSRCVSDAPSSKRSDQLTKRAMVPRMAKRDTSLEDSLKLFTDVTAVRFDGDAFMAP